jgi:D-aminopeptidase
VISDLEGVSGVVKGGKEWSFNSLVPDLLDPGCEFVVQEDWTEYTFLEEGCDAALLVGMHAMAGARMGVMNHTVSGKDLHTLAADKLRFRPGVERVDNRTISVTADTWWEAWKTFYF